MAACPPGTSAEAKALEAIQSKATALVFGLKFENSEGRRRKLGLMTLQHRRERGGPDRLYQVPSFYIY